MDRVRPLKYESPSTGGTQTNEYPTELNPSEDYISAKGVSFGPDPNFVIDMIGRAIVSSFPQLYQNISYSGGDVSSIDFYNSENFIVANRVARVELTYTFGNISSEVLKIYDTNGSTILRTYTWTHVYSGGDISSSNVAVS